MAEDKKSPAAKKSPVKKARKKTAAKTAPKAASTAASQTESSPATTPATTPNPSARKSGSGFLGMGDTGLIIMMLLYLTILLPYARNTAGLGGGAEAAEHGEAGHESGAVAATEHGSSDETGMSASLVGPAATIERHGEGRHFYTTIRIPAAAETLYLSGSGARRQADGSYGDMYQQTTDTFNRFQDTLDAEGWSMSDIIQVRAFAVAGEFGLLDFDGFNRAYRNFFGTEDNPMKPVRTFVQIAGLANPDWLVEIEIRAARLPEH